MGGNKLVRSSGSSAVSPSSHSASSSVMSLHRKRSVSIQFLHLKPQNHQCQGHAPRGNMARAIICFSRSTTFPSMMIFLFLCNDVLGPIIIVNGREPLVPTTRGRRSIHCTQFSVHVAQKKRNERTKDETRINHWHTESQTPLVTHF